MNMNDIDELQIVADKICKHFKMKPILLRVNGRLKTTHGLYRHECIDFNPKVIGLGLLVHELAHHLKLTKYDQRKDGYYKMEMWPKMVFDHVDENGVTQFSAKGEPSPVYIRTGTSHDKKFWECIRDIKRFAWKIVYGVILPK